MPRASQLHYTMLVNCPSWHIARCFRATIRHVFEMINR